ncbi:MAG: SLC13 family permease [Phycisphaerae bacterium]
MTWQAALTLGVMLVVIAAVLRAPHMGDVLFLAATALLALVGVLSPRDAFAGFTNEGVLTIAALFIVAAGLVETGLIGRLAQRILGRDADPARALSRIVPPIVCASAFLNNTTIVAMAMPVLLDWARRHRVAASRLLLPLSFAAILGGVCTLIGTSTNLVVHGMLRSIGLPGLGMWELGKAGIPIAVAGTLLLIVLAPRWLPDRKEFLEQLGESRREYLVEMAVQPGCPLVGQSVEAAGLRHLPGLFLVEIDRAGQRIAPVEPAEPLCAGDRLVFTGVVSTIVDLQKIPGLVAAADDRASLTLGKNRGFVEAVISPSSPLVGRGVREVNFRTTYNAAVLAVHRAGVRLRQKIGDIVLRPGDTLLLLTKGGFVRAHRNNPDFHLVSEAGEATPVRHAKAPLAALIAVAFVACITLPDLLAVIHPGSAVAQFIDERRAIIAVLAAGLMLLTRCLSISAARRAIDWQVVVLVAAAIGLGQAMQRSGAADLVADHAIVPLAGHNPRATLAGVYLLTWLLTELMSNNAAAALMFPIAVAGAARCAADPRPFAIAVALAASGGFLIPSGYQTHLMVFGPGGYRTSDFLKLGLPMALLWFAIAMLLVPIFWPLTH